MIFYLIAIVIPVLTFLLFRKKPFYVAIFYTINLATLLILIYSFLLSIYFHSIYMGQLTVYPSLVISEWWGYIFVYLVLRVDLMYFLFYVKRNLHL